MKKHVCVSILASVLLLFAATDAYAQDQGSLLYAPTPLMGSARMVKPLNKPANALEVDEERNLYLLHTNESRLRKYFHLFAYDSAISVSGAGLRTEGLYRPVKARIAARNKLYLLDYANRRISLFSVNLRPLRSWDFTDPRTLPGNEYRTPIFPVSFTVSPQGDMYVLNAEDNRVIKYDHRGELQIIFGGMDFGDGTLRNPVELEFDPDDFMNPYIYVADTVAQEIKTFDIFGVFGFTLTEPTPFRWRGLRIYGRRLILWDKSHIWIHHLDDEHPIRYLSAPDDMRIVDIAPHRSGVYILTDKAVILYGQ